MIDLRFGDCLEVMKEIPSKSIDAIICDLPYGTTACKWDVVIPFDLLWEQYNRIIKPNGVIVLFGSEPFSSHLRLSNLNMFKYDWIWEKNSGGNPFVTKYQPAKEHEIISVFYKKHGTYNQQRIFRSDKSLKRDPIGKERIYEVKDEIIEHIGVKRPNNIFSKDGKRCPRSIIKFNKREKGTINDGYKHPTRKPLELLKYLVKTYTNEGDLVLDNTMGSGTTMVACKKLNRNGIGIEMDENYFNIAEERINS
jgi:site-specific DNA-methyltransferase (adenine-specific)